MMSPNDVQYALIDGYAHCLHMDLHIQNDTLL